MKITAEPRSDQWNADDFIGGPRVFTIAGVKTGSAEQKYDVQLVEGEGRVWRPPLTVLRLLIAAWGDEAAEWTGRRVELYRDTSITFGPDAVGGIRISRMSDLPNGKALTVKLTSKRGKRAAHTVDPLPDGPKLITADTAAEFGTRITTATATDELESIVAELKTWELGAFRDDLLNAYRNRLAEIKAGSAPADVEAS